MQRHQQNKRPLVDFFAIVKYFALLIIFSLIAYGVKTVVLSALSASPTKQVGNGMLTLFEVHNTGAAFNLFSNQPEMIVMASFLAVAVLMFVVLVASAKLSQGSISAMALLTSGISMNLLERLQQGYVVDYIQCNFIQNSPVFNVPDIMIVIGAIGLMFSVLSRN